MTPDPSTSPRQAGQEFAFKIWAGITAARRRSESDFIVQEYGSDRMRARVSRWNGVIPDRNRRVGSQSLDEAPDGFGLCGSGSLSAETGVEGIAQVVNDASQETLADEPRRANEVPFFLFALALVG